MLGDVLERVRNEVNPEANLVWAGTNLLEEKGVEPWSDLPFVLSYSGSDDGMGTVSVEKAGSLGS